MPNAKNQSMLSAIKEDLEGAGAVWVVDYLRPDREGDRRQLRNDSPRDRLACMKVYKNTLVCTCALSEAELPTLDDMLAWPERVRVRRLRRGRMRLRP